MVSFQDETEADGGAKKIGLKWDVTGDSVAFSGTYIGGGEKKSGSNGNDNVRCHRHC